MGAWERTGECAFVGSSLVLACAPMCSHVLRHISCTLTQQHAHAQSSCAYAHILYTCTEYAAREGERESGRAENAAGGERRTIGSNALRAALLAIQQHDRVCDDQALLAQRGRRFIDTGAAGHHVLHYEAPIHHALCQSSGTYPPCPLSGLPPPTHSLTRTHAHALLEEAPLALLEDALDHLPGPVNEQGGGGQEEEEGENLSPCL